MPRTPPRPAAPPGQSSLANARASRVCAQTGDIRPYKHTPPFHGAFHARVSVARPAEPARTTDPPRAERTGATNAPHRHIRLAAPHAPLLSRKATPASRRFGL